MLHCQLFSEFNAVKIGDRRPYIYEGFFFFMLGFDGCKNMMF